jgi:hypothetical protein
LIASESESADERDEEIYDPAPLTPAFLFYFLRKIHYSCEKNSRLPCRPLLDIFHFLKTPLSFPRRESILLLWKDNGREYVTNSDFEYYCGSQGTNQTYEGMDIGDLNLLLNY